MAGQTRISLARAYAVGAALAFVAALASVVLLDLRLARSAAHRSPLPVDTGGLLFDATLFTVFALHHSVMARTGAKAWLTRHLHPALERSTYVWVASGLLVAVSVLWRPLPQVVYQADPPWSWLFTLARLVGVWMTIDAASRIDPRELAGLRQAWTFGGREAAGASAAIAVDAAEPLVSRGGYRLVRHPIYLGWMLMVWGVPLMTLGRLVFAAVSTGYLLLAIPFEERSLRERYGHGYGVYQRTVRWRVLPGLY